jgi:hypothetical protein
LAKKELNTVEELLYWSYANLAMAHTALDKGQESYGRFNYIIRSRLYKGLIDKKMSVSSIIDDEKLKIVSGSQCSYCGSIKNLAMDHILPKKYGGKDTGENLVYACRSCNSSKGAKDLMEWMSSREEFPPLMVLRRYLKIVIGYCLQNDLMDCHIKDVEIELPFKLAFIPIDYPKPSDLRMLAEKIS